MRFVCIVIGCFSLAAQSVCSFYASCCHHYLCRSLGGLLTHVRAIHLCYFHRRIIFAEVYSVLGSEGAGTLVDALLNVRRSIIMYYNYTVNIIESTESCRTIVCDEASTDNSTCLRAASASLLSPCRYSIQSNTDRLYSLLHYQNTCLPNRYTAPNQPLHACFISCKM